TSRRRTEINTASLNVYTPNTPHCQNSQHGSKPCHSRVVKRMLFFSQRTSKHQRPRPNIWDRVYGICRATRIVLHGDRLRYPRQIAEAEIIPTRTIEISKTLIIARQLW